MRRLVVSANHVSPMLDDRPSSVLELRPRGRITRLGEGHVLGKTFGRATSAVNTSRFDTSRPRAPHGPVYVSFNPGSERQRPALGRITMRVALCIAILAAMSSSLPQCAEAAGVNLAWSACLPEGGLTNRNFGCGTNSGTNVMVASFVLSADQQLCTGIEATVEITASADSLPNWWQFFNSAACRQTALSTAFDFSSDPGTSCTDMRSGQAVGGIGAYHTYWTSPQVPSGQPNQARVRLAAAVPSTSPLQLVAETEYYAFKLLVSNAKTVGSGSCGGCQTPVCVLLSEINVVQADGQHESMTGPAASNLVTWQAAMNCPGGMAQQNLTWGQIRSIAH